jgi:hypothetical protein
VLNIFLKADASKPVFSFSNKIKKGTGSKGRILNGFTTLRGQQRNCYSFFSQVPDGL